MEDGAVLLISLIGLIAPIGGLILAALSALGMAWIGTVVRRKAAAESAPAEPVTMATPQP
jgi:hypothetical protein